MRHTVNVRQSGDVQYLLPTFAMVRSEASILLDSYQKEPSTAFLKSGNAVSMRALELIEKLAVMHRVHLLEALPDADPESYSWKGVDWLAQPERAQREDDLLAARCKAISEKLITSPIEDPEPRVGWGKLAQLSGFQIDKLEHLLTLLPDLSVPKSRLPIFAPSLWGRLESSISPNKTNLTLHAERIITLSSAQSVGSISGNAGIGGRRLL